MNYDSLFAHPGGRTSRAEFVPALIVLLAAYLFYYMLVFGPSGRYGMLVMLVPAFVLHARRLHDMGRSGWWLLVPPAPIAAAIWLYLAGSGALFLVKLAAAAVCAGFVLWSAIGSSGGDRRP